MTCYPRSSSHQEAVKDVSAHVVTATVKEVMCSWGGGSRKSQQAAPRGDCASGSSSSSSSSSSPRAAGIPMSTFSESESEAQQPAREPAKSPAAEVAEVLAQPSIRKLILDVTAVTTSRGMEAFLLVLSPELLGSSSCSSSSPTLTLREVSSCSDTSTFRDCSTGAASTGGASTVCAKASVAGGVLSSGALSQGDSLHGPAPRPLPPGLLPLRLSA